MLAGGAIGVVIGLVCGLFQRLSLFVAVMLAACFVQGAALYVDGRPALGIALGIGVVLLATQAGYVVGFLLRALASERPSPDRSRAPQPRLSLAGLFSDRRSTPPKDRSPAAHRQGRT